MKIDRTGVEEAIHALLVAVGEDPEREGLKDTPARVARSYSELLGGYVKNTREILGTTFNADGYDQMIALSGIDFYSLCEHHLLPFIGHATVAYIPAEKAGKVVGLSKLARLVDVYARRLQIQERMTMNIADALWTVLEPRGVGVVIKAQHLCMCARGVGKQNATMTTSKLKGLIKDDGKARAEFTKLADL